MRRALTLLALLLALALPCPARAADPVTFQTLDVDVWPEYDQPAVLVIYRITLSGDTKLPAELTLRFPKSAGAPAALAEQTASGLYNLAYTQSGEYGDYNLYTFSVTLPQLQLEYYDTDLQAQGSTRSYAFHWPGDYPVDDFTLSIQQPRTASNLRLQPDTGVSGPGADGLTYITVPVGNVTAGTDFTIRVSYDKADDTLTQPEIFEQVTPVSPVQDAAFGRVTLNALVPWLLGSVGLLLISVGIAWWVKTGREEINQPARRRRTADTDSNAPIFCNQCGKRASPGDNFCRACGAKLKK